MADDQARRSAAGGPDQPEGTERSGYRRVLVKFSGEALMGEQSFGLDPAVVQRVAGDIAGIAGAGVEVAVVVGAGNIFRGVSLSASGMDRAAADQVGMLATVINALSLQEAVEREGVPARVMSALSVRQVCEDYVRRDAVAHLEAGRVVVLAAGTGNPFFTTDSAAALRGVELHADLVLKATKVDGVYSADPVRDPSATRYSRLSYDQALQERLGVMDATALILCRDHGLPLRVYDMNKPGALERIVRGEDEGTLVEAGETQ